MLGGRNWEVLLVDLRRDKGVGVVGLEMSVIEADFCIRPNGKDVGKGLGKRCSSRPIRKNSGQEKGFVVS
jgi:hypothetical protein